jgi:cytolysin (calcineurin-like family phosphatase)
MFKRVFFCIITIVLASCSAYLQAPDQKENTYNDITFFITTDTHYGAGDDESISANQATIDLMNSLPGTLYPVVLGGTVDTPRGVIVLGDLTQDGLSDEWEWFTADYGLDGRGRSNYPVYEGWGNHDCHNERMIVRDGILARNKKRPGLTNVSDNGYHYSWDWEDVHFIQLNIYPGGGSGDPNSWGNPEDSMTFLIDDLQKHVGTSDRAVILFLHFSFDDWGLENWQLWEQDNFYNAVKNYNIIAMFGGHGHTMLYGNWRGIDYYEIPASQPVEDSKGFGVIRITKDKLIVTVRNNTDSWHTKYYVKNLF